tara:strand:+ start:244 stop:897 length:654 start_codon:yes stop_codon:yes gene_type:complete
MELNKFNSLNYKLKIVDNFLNQEDFKDLCELDISKEVKNEFNVYHNEINDNGIIKSVIDKSLLKRIHKNYHSSAISILKEINPAKVNLYEYSDFSIIVTSKNSKFPIHDDTPNKLLSGVIYLYPSDNTGTIFYNDKKGSGRTNVDWKPNRAAFFSRKERETWHSYEGDGINNRIVLVYNLMTTKIREVYKIEKKNYHFGKFRWKANPYIFRYLKTTI